MRSSKSASASTKPKQIRAVGYVRVSTEVQASEGVSLHTQRTKIRAHCIAHDIDLIEIISDDGVSAKSIDRPGLRRALWMLDVGKADAVVVVKLDRLTRSVKDLGVLCERYFGEGKQWSLLAVSDSIDTRSAAGKLVLNVLMSVAQWEREAICERTREGMHHLKQLGVQLGAAPYGWRYTKETDSHGRRVLVEDPEEQRGIARIRELYDADEPMRRMCEILTEEGVPCRGTQWYSRTLHSVLQRAGVRDPVRRKKSAPSKTERHAATPDAVRDKQTAALRAAELRQHGLSLRQIASTLHQERILPQRGDIWYAAGVMDLLRMSPPTGRGVLRSNR